MQRAGVGVGVDAVLAERDALDVRAVGDHRDDHLGALDGLGDGRGAPAALLDELVECGLAVVAADDVVAGGDEVPGHGGTHDAEPDERDRGHVSPRWGGGGDVQG